MKIEFFKNNELANKSIILVNELNLSIFIKLLILGKNKLIIFIKKPNNKFLLKFLLLLNFDLKLFNMNVLNLTHKDKANEQCYKVLEYLNKKKISDNFFLSFLAKLYDSNQIQSIYSKYISLKLYNFFYLNLFSNYIFSKNSNFLFISDLNFFYAYKLLLKINHANNINFKIINPKFLFYVRYLSFKLIYLSILLIFPFLLIAKIRLISKIIDNIPFFIRLYNRGYRLNLNSKRIDWIIDDKNFSKKNTMFISEDKLDKIFISDLFDNKYQYSRLSVLNFKVYINRLKIFSEIKLIFKIYFKYFFLIFSINNNDLKFMLISLFNHFKWTSLLTKYKIKLFLTYQDFSTQALLRNIIFENNNVVSVLYKSTYSESVFTNNMMKHRLLIYTYSNYDYEFHWGKKSIEFAKSCYGNSRNYIPLKPLWSNKNNINNKKFNKNKIKIVAFSSSFNLNSVNSNNDNDHLEFLKSLYLLVKQNNFIVYFKSKSPFTNYQFSKNIDLKLLSLDLIKKLNFKVVDNNHSSVKLIEDSDISISMSFASTTIEALCLGKKSFYFDGNNNYPTSEFHTLPYFVCTNKKNIIMYLDYWINLDDNDLLQFYEKNLKKEFGNLNFDDDSMTILKRKILNSINFKYYI